MSECMIVRRGGRSSGGGFDPNGAVLKVITSTNCTVLVTGTGYSETHQQADGFPRSGDANVTEHFFSIPASAFGTITVKATNTYGVNTNTITVDTAGKVYEQFSPGKNYIIDSTFGKLDGVVITPANQRGSATYDADLKTYGLYATGNEQFILSPTIDVSIYSKVAIKGSISTAIGTSSCTISAIDKDGAVVNIGAVSGTSIVKTFVLTSTEKSPFMFRFYLEAGSQFAITRFALI